MSIVFTLIALLAAFSSSATESSKGINPVQHSERTATPSKGINPVQHSE